MKGEGAIVFLMVFFAMLLATLAYPTMPPGRQIYSFLGVPDTDSPVLGIPATPLVIAVFNGVVYGIIAWLIFTFAVRTIRARKTV
jgi:hypothetical protein